MCKHLLKYACLFEHPDHPAWHSDSGLTNSTSLGRDCLFARPIADEENTS